MIKFWSLVLCLWSLVFGLWSPSYAAEYDGIWFLSFNLSTPPFNNIKVREAVSRCLDLHQIATQIASEESQPASFIPPGMGGYDGTIKSFKQNLKFAKRLMQDANYLPNNSILKNLTLLHTNGVKTIAIAKKIQFDLKQIGLSLKLIEMDSLNEEKWGYELASKKYSLFLMGFKGDSPSELLGPLFKTNGEANFSGYSNLTFDRQLEQAANQGLNRTLYKDLPAILLFYIEKL